jgi:hypothetical protein
VRIDGLLDPQSGAHARAAIDAVVQYTVHDDSGRSREQRTADALTELCCAYAKGDVGGGRRRPQLLVTVDYDTIFERAGGVGTTQSGDTLSAESLRQLCCDAGLHRVVTRGRSTILDFGAEVRLASESLYLALVARDGGCRWSGCAAPAAWCEVHHIVERENGGPTNQANCCLMCATHHRQAHVRGITLTGDGFGFTIALPGGRVLHSRPPGPLGAAPTNPPADVPHPCDDARVRGPSSYAPDQLTLVG